MTNKLKICFFADGESVHVVRWCKHFVSLGNEVHLISFKNVVIEDVKTHFINCGNISVKGGNWKVLFKYKEVKKLLAKIQPNIFHSHYATSYGITGALCGFRPYIITCLGTDVLISPKQSIIYKLLLKFAFSKTNWITAMADHMKLTIAAMGVESTKISVVPFGIDPLIFNDNNRQLSPNKFVITSTRNFEPIYNILNLIKAVSIAKKEIPEIHLNLIGTGSLKLEIEKLVVDSKLSANTTFYGKVTQSIISEVLQKSHLFISISLSDGNNVSLNEAMACGVLCIASNIPANTQWIENNKNGFLVETDDIQSLADKIVISYRNYNLINEKASLLNKQLIIEKAIWATNMKKVEEKYQSLIKKK